MACKAVELRLWVSNRRKRMQPWHVPDNLMFSLCPITLTLQRYLIITTNYHGQDTLTADFIKGIWENIFPQRKHVKCSPELIATFASQLLISLSPQLLETLCNEIMGNCSSLSGVYEPVTCGLTCDKPRPKPKINHAKLDPEKMAVKSW